MRSFPRYTPRPLQNFVYVHLQSGWDSRPGNLLFEVTNVWNNGGPAAAGAGAHAPVPPGPTGAGPPAGAYTYNHNRLRHADGRAFVELWHRFSDCRDNWQPSTYRYGIDLLRNRFEAAAGGGRGGAPPCRITPMR